MIGQFAFPSGFNLHAMPIFLDLSAIWNWSDDKNSSCAQNMFGALLGPCWVRVPVLTDTWGNTSRVHLRGRFLRRLRSDLTRSLLKLKNELGAT